MGEKFSPDLHTGTGNFSVPIALPSGRNGFQPKLELAYSTGAGNGSYGLGWSLPIPRVARKTQSMPPFPDAADPKQLDVFILSGTEDLVPLGAVANAAGRTEVRSNGSSNSPIPWDFPLTSE